MANNMLKSHNRTWNSLMGQSFNALHIQGWFVIVKQDTEAIDHIYRILTEAILGGWRGPPRHPLSVSGGGDATSWEIFATP